MATLCRRSLPFRNQLSLITRHARYVITSPTRMPSCLSVLASSLLFELIIAIGGTIPALLLHWLGLRLGNGWGSVRRLAGRRRRSWFRSRRHRLFKRYQRIPSDRLSDLCHD